MSRADDWKQTLMIWRQVLLPMNNLLEWEHTYDPPVIFASISLSYLAISAINPSVLTLISSLMITIVSFDLLAPMAIKMIFKHQTWTPAQDEKYNRLCAHIAHFEQHVKHRCQSMLTMREERPLMYLMIGVICFAFLAICGQRIDNGLLIYLIALIVCLTPGICHRQLLNYFMVATTEEKDKSKLQ